MIKPSKAGTIAILAWSLIFVAGAFIDAHAMEKSEMDKTCTVAGKVASRIMINRQGGILLTNAMKQATDSLLRDMTLEAYEKPIYPTVESSARIVAEFSNKWTLECYKILGELK